MARRRELTPTTGDAVREAVRIFAWADWFDAAEPVPARVEDGTAETAHLHRRWAARQRWRLAGELWCAQHHYSYARVVLGSAWPAPSEVASGCTGTPPGWVPGLRHVPQRPAQPLDVDGSAIPASGDLAGP